jgi:hypothetical protein
MANNVYAVNGRLSQLENAVAELKKENAELRTHLWGALETKANDLKHVIQDSIRTPVDGKDGRSGVDGATGPQGAKGERGDVLVPNETELQQAVQELRLKLARWQAAIQFAHEQNSGQTHRGLKAAIAATLKAIEQQAQ